MFHVTRNGCSTFLNYREIVSFGNLRDITEPYVRFFAYSNFHREHFPATLKIRKQLLLDKVRRSGQLHAPYNSVKFSFVCCFGQRAVYERFDGVGLNESPCIRVIRKNRSASRDDTVKNTCNEYLPYNVAMKLFKSTSNINKTQLLLQIFVRKIAQKKFFFIDKLDR